MGEARGKPRLERIGCAVKGKFANNPDSEIIARLYWPTDCCLTIIRLADVYEATLRSQTLLLSSIDISPFRAGLKLEHDRSRDWRRHIPEHVT